ncbi:hypothetical protein ANCCEY_13146 [Ancylostoma ceylanicum]|nr:hypothetical protein ANCCEY_13146 [Ancylostoma ceylanicum]EYC43699.1 hypothetical protein Y032_0483g2292 [Ancylostoma ceylanicum]
MIHISKAANDLLNEVGGYKTESRGEVIIKGKGVMETYWLIGPSDGSTSSQIHPAGYQGLSNNLESTDNLSNASTGTVTV